MSKRTKKFYVVWTGRVPGVYDNWQEVKSQVDGFEGARFKGFLTEEEAAEAFKSQPPPLPAFLTKKTSSPKPPADNNASPLKDAIAVDAACGGNPGVLEYRGITLWDNKEVFHRTFPLGTNNIGEFLAIVEALARLKKEEHGGKIAIYSDSKIAMGWVKAKKCRTKLAETDETRDLLDIVRRAEIWLANNSYENEIIKWPTEKWGEIPADFGRK